MDNSNLEPLILAFIRPPRRFLDHTPLRITPQSKSRAPASQEGSYPVASPNPSGSPEVWLLRLRTPCQRFKARRFDTGFQLCRQMVKSIKDTI